MNKPQNIYKLQGADNSRARRKEEEELREEGRESKRRREFAISVMVQTQKVETCSKSVHTEVVVTKKRNKRTQVNKKTTKKGNLARLLKAAKRLKKKRGRTHMHHRARRARVRVHPLLHQMRSPQPRRRRNQRQRRSRTNVW